MFNNVFLKKLLVGLWMGALSMQTSATCAIEEVTSNGFGSVTNQSNVATREVAGVSIQCEGNYRIALNAGNFPSTNRRLSDGAGHFIDYLLWQNPAGSLTWGDASTYPATPLNAIGSQHFYPIYGSALTSQAQYAGIYSDTVRVTVNYPPFGSHDKIEADIRLQLNLSGLCQLDTSGFNGFGDYPLGTPNLQRVALGTLNVQCTAGTPYAVGIDAGTHWNAKTTGSRHLSYLTHYIPYQLFSDVSCSREWGDQGLAAFEASHQPTHPAAALHQQGTGSIQTFFVWGNAAIQTTNVPAGTYADILQITLVWP